VNCARKGCGHPILMHLVSQLMGKCLSRGCKCVGYLKP
jgi:hypothetical protein